jgi:hypothetical protein
MSIFRRLRNFIRSVCGAVLLWYVLSVGVTAYIWRAELREGTMSPTYVAMFPAEFLRTVTHFTKTRLTTAMMLPFDPNWGLDGASSGDRSPIVSDSLATKWPGAPEWPVDTWTRLPVGMAVPSPATLAGKVVIIYCFQHW